MKKVLLTILISSLLMLTGCNTDTSINNNTSSLPETTETTTAYDEFDRQKREYKIFLGEWEITECIGDVDVGLYVEKKKSPEIDTTQFIGQRIIFYDGMVKFNKIQYLSPYYSIKIFPIEGNYGVYDDPGFTRYSDLGLDKNDFVIQVDIRPQGKPWYSPFKEIGASFYIKNDDELIIFYRYNANHYLYYKAERISHINNYQTYYQQV